MKLGQYGSGKYCSYVVEIGGAGMIMKVFISAICLFAFSSPALAQDECSELSGWEFYYKDAYDYAQEQYESFDYANKWDEIQNYRNWAIGQCQNDAICIGDVIREVDTRSAQLSQEFTDLSWAVGEAYGMWWSARSARIEAGCSEL
ncbi:hypothetical protein [Sphingomonas sp. Root241]|uniref:hypothetical protein n=1 Tax=Sphingomonas sp. Root241 TaxID=1736501 RepID=UPI0012E3CF1A|nr:hypothetical protein [Sphingomonas sp. Root241]